MAQSKIVARTGEVDLRLNFGSWPNPDIARAGAIEADLTIS